MESYITLFLIPLVNCFANNDKQGIIELFNQGYEINMEDFSDDFLTRHLAVMAKSYATIYN